MNRSSSTHPIDSQRDLFHQVITQEQAGQRFDHWLSGQLDGLSRSVVKTLIIQGDFTVSDQHVKPSLILTEGDEVRGEVDTTSILQWNPNPLELEILFEDPWVLVVNKPPNILSHPGAKQINTTLIEGVMWHLDYPALNPDRLEQLDSSKSHSIPPRFGLLHRLDKDTTGALIIAKTKKGYQHLHNQLQNRQILREYVALCEGCSDTIHTVCESYLSRSIKDRSRFESTSIEMIKARYPHDVPTRFRYAKSEFHTKATFGHQFELCCVRLSTGRTHQIRCHALWLNRPILGDPTYTKTSKRKSLKRGQSSPLARYLGDLGQKAPQITRQMLHARTLGFVHPHTQSFVKVTAPLPIDFREVLQSLQATIS